MTAPRTDGWTQTSIRFRPGVHERLVIAAAERDVSVSWLVGKGVEEFLDRLIPVDELRLTRPVAAPGDETTTDPSTPGHAAQGTT